MKGAGSDDRSHHEEPTRGLLPNSQMGLHWDLPVLTSESFAPAVEHEAESCLDVQSGASERAPPASVAKGDGLDTALTHIAQQCGVSVVLVLWHRKDAEVQVVTRRHPAPTSVCGLTVCREHAMEAVLQSSRQAPGHQRWQLFRSRACCTALIPLAEGIGTLTVLPQPTGSGSVETRWAKFETFLPFVAACFEQWFATQEAITRARNFCHAIEASGTATILLGDNGEILHANGAAETILEEKDGLCRLKERLVCASFTDTLRLQAALSHFHAQLEAGAETTPVLAVSRANRRPLTVALAAVRSDPNPTAGTASAIAYVFDPEQKVSGLINPVCQLYGLSKSETRLACALVAGDSLSSAAQRLRLQEQTARTYLKHIFDKTDTHRQAQLVQLMLESAVRITTSMKIQAFI